MTTLTDAIEAEIKKGEALCEKATPGPWEDHGSPSDDEPYIQLTHCRLIISGDNEPGMWDDWQFVQQSRTALPDLATLAEQAIARAEKAEAERDSERTERGKLAHLLRQKDEAMGVLFDRLRGAGVDYSDLIP